MPIQVCLLFVLVAQNEGSSQATFEKALGISRSAISRGAARLSHYGWNNKPGLDLIDMREDPTDRRYKVLHLTPKGRLLIRQIMGAIRYGSQKEG
jgi:DNA-binding MarR family transcriptional regulator